MVAWVLAFRVRFAEAVERVLAAPPATLDHSTLYQLRQSGLAESHAAETGRLLRRLMRAAMAVQFEVRCSILRRPLLLMVPIAVTC